MGTSTDGQICYGIAFEEGHEFPWDEKYGGDIDEWWVMGVHQYKPSFELFNEKGEYLNGVEPSKNDTSRYFQERREFAEARPLPVELVNCCSGDYPQWIIAAKGTVTSARRGHPEVISKEQLEVSPDQEQALIQFCNTHGIDVGSEAKWFLSSYWG